MSGGGGSGRIALDATPLRRNGKGASRFLGDLLAEIARRPPETPVDVCVTAGASLPALPQAPCLRYHPVPARPAILWEQLALPLWVRARRPEVLFTLRERLAPRVACPFVVYLFETPDQRLESESRGWYGRGAAAYTRRFFAPTLARAAAVLCSSRWTREDLERRYAPPVSAEVIPPGIGRGFGPLAGDGTLRRVRETYSEGRPFIFMIASADPREETGAPMKAFGAVARHDRAPLLLIAGRADRARRRALAAAARAAGCAERMRHLGYCSDGALRKLYAAAEIYLEVTRFEGFGLQVAEALACGAPVVAAGAGAVPEVVADAALLVPPGDRGALTDALVRLWGAPEERAVLRERACARARAFSWDVAWPRLLSRWAGAAAGTNGRRGEDRCSE